MLLTLVALALAPQQLPEDPGPYLPGWQVVSFSDANYGAGIVRARVYYPALIRGRDTAVDFSGAPYQPVAIMHGWTGSANTHDDLGNHLASHGYLVINLDTEKGIFPNVPAYAVDARAALQWLEDESQFASSWLSGMAMVGVDWAAIGHSMGGGTLSHLVGIENRVRAIIGMQAASSDEPGPSNMRAYTGAGIWIAGSVDRIVRPNVVKAWYDRAEVAERRMYVNVQGMGHSGPTDTPPNNEPMLGADQKRVHLRILTLFLDAELRGEDSAYEYLVSKIGMGAPWTYEQQSARPILWGGEDLTSSSALFGIHGLNSSVAVFAWSAQLGSSSTPFGDTGIDLDFGGATTDIPLSAEAWGMRRFGFPPSWSGTTVHFQAAVYRSPIEGALTKVLSLQIP
ncbi:MAG: hypothetical protein MK209_10585 [Planctomycetes bacterium]|nr:hypothetical protein [Planctomycetota bacterium]